MAGGLIQIVTHGSQDLYLTGAPEITFFKIVYRRFTNFSMESIYINFDNQVGFGKKSTVNIQKVGDLMHKTYLEITLPQINFQRNTMPTPDPTDKNIVLSNYQTVVNFMTLNRPSGVEIIEAMSANNVQSTDFNTIVSTSTTNFTTPSGIPIVNAMQALLLTNVPYSYNELSVQELNYNIVASYNNNFNNPDLSPFTDQQKKDAMIREVNNRMTKSIYTQKYYYNLYLAALDAYNDSINPNIKFAWVDKIGHSIIDEIELYIGGQKIDRQYGDWINIWHELSGSRDMEDIYNNLIGNIPILTTFDRSIKPEYTLRVPLQFFYCRYSGLSIPLVALEYHDVRIDVKFRNINDVSYIETGTLIKSTDTSGISLQDTVDDLNININARLMIDYIFISGTERRRFAQASHEYLIDQLQVLEFSDIPSNQQSINCLLDNFVHPSKELVWVAQDTAYIDNLSGTHKNMWNNYSSSENGTGRPLMYCSMDFHSYNRIAKFDTVYFNYIQPYEYHTATPSDGINVYSFSIMPEEFQPSGSANLSRISRMMLFLEFDPTLYDSERVFNIRIYTRNFNILRILSGMGALAYTFG